MLLGLACRDMGDEDGAELELTAGRDVLRRLGAKREASRLEELLTPAEPPAGLSPRELEVLRLLATGGSNREIAARLVISEHTVARHVQSILRKLDVGSRTGAAAFAHEHDLV